MPPWPSRLLSAPSVPTSNNPSPSSPSRNTDKPVPNPRQDSAAGNASSGSVPTLHSQRNAYAVSPTKPNGPTSRQHVHNRSVSGPLPRVFGRKKSAGNLIGRINQDLPPDDALVPVLDEPQARTPTKPINGKKKLEDDQSAAKHCMCCDSKVRFPRGLKVFRCTTCLTINDLEPLDPRQKANGDGKQADGRLSARSVPLTVERTRAIIDQCLTAYLLARSRREQDRPQARPIGLAITSAATAPTACNMPVRQSTTSQPMEQQAQRLASCSPIKAAATHQKPTATIRDITDFNDLSYFGGYEDTASVPASSSPRRIPSTTSPLDMQSTVPSPTRKPPPVPVRAATTSRPTDALRRMIAPPSAARRPSSSQVAGATGVQPREEQDRYERIKKIFKPLEDYMNDSFGSVQCLASSFSTVKPAERRDGESAIKTPPPETAEASCPSPMIDQLDQMDAKTLLLGDFAENGGWWTGRLGRNRSETKRKDSTRDGEKIRLVNSKSPLVDWEELDSWYDMVHTAGQGWYDRLDQLHGLEHVKDRLGGPRVLEDVERDIADAREHAQRALLKITENILKRPMRPLKEPEDVRFLIIILSNPSLYPQPVHAKRCASASRPRPDRATSLSRRLHDAPSAQDPVSPPGSPTKISREPGQHAGILKRIFGLLANSSDTCHRYLVGWFTRFREPQLTKLIDLVASFVTYRLSRQKAPARSNNQPQDGGLIPVLTGTARQVSAQLQSATGISGGVKKSTEDSIPSVVEYSEDWQLKAAAKVMALVFAANNAWQAKNAGSALNHPTAAPSALRPRAKAHGQLLSTSDFYNTLLDYHDLIADFKAWESKKAKFSFCQYPFFLSMGSKIKILEYDARRQMEHKAREAYFDTVTSHRAIDGYFHLRVRRDCMVDDSLRQISEAVGADNEELKKGLRVHFTGEEGVDAGGLRKEWFLMLVRDIFDPNHGMFIYDEDSLTCYFNPNSFETSDQYYLVGALLGLAIYNSTILDVALPPFAFRKLLASAPVSTSNPSLPVAGTRGSMTYTIDDLAEYRPALAAGLRQLLDFSGDVETTFCRDFVAPVERYGTVQNVPLCSNGEARAVTNANRQEYVNLYVRYLLDTAVARQFEPFKRGFFTVCAGNALSLFRAEEIELLVRGSDEALDVDSLKAVAVYENWRSASAPGGTSHPSGTPGKIIPCPAEAVPVVAWFWDTFRSAQPLDQRKLLSFITASDRIPAVGATNLVLKIVAGGDGTGRTEGEGERFPIARTCFNMLVLWRYETREKMEEKLWRAVRESEGFGLK